MAKKTTIRLKEELHEKIEISQRAADVIKYFYDILQKATTDKSFEEIKKDLIRLAGRVYKLASPHKYREFFHTKMLIEIKRLQEK